MEISTERHGETIVIKAAGRVDSSNSREFHSGIEGAITADDQAVVVDFAELAYISSAGMRVVLLLAKSLKGKQVKFALCSMSDAVSEIFKISGFDKIIAIHESQAEAVAAVAA